MNKHSVVFERLVFTTDGMMNGIWTYRISDMYLPPDMDIGFVVLNESDGLWHVCIPCKDIHDADTSRFELFERVAMRYIYGKVESI